MRSFLLLMTLFAAATLSPLSARAQEHPASPAGTVPDDPPRDRLEARIGTGFVTGSFPHLTVRRADVGVGLMYFPYFLHGIPLALGTSVHIGPSFLEMNGALADGLGMDAALAHWYNLSLEASAELTVYKDKRLSFDLYGGFEMSAFDDRMDFTRADLATGQGTFEITPFLDKHLDLRYSWNRMDVGVVAKVRLGAFTPRLGIGFQRMLLRITAETDKEGKFVLANLGDKTGAIERLYEEDFTALRIAPGIDWRTGKAFAFTLDTFFMPTAEALFCGGSLGTRVTF